MSDKFLVIDGSSLIHRAFFALPPLTTRKGQHTGAVYGFLRMFHKLLQDVKPRWVAAAFDKSRKTFRTKLLINPGRPSARSYMRITKASGNPRRRS